MKRAEDAWASVSEPLKDLSNTWLVNQDSFLQYRETSALRHVLKFLRQRRHFSSFRALQSRTGIILEHPIVAKIYDNLMSGDWSFVESLIETASNDALFDGYTQACDPKALWRRLNGANPDGDAPSPRGGHQMCIDSEAGLIYLFGGWDGEKSLDDFWVYTISEGRWKILSSSTALDNGPGPRCCHKMVFDPLFGYIYLLGRLADGEGLRSPSPAHTVTLADPQDNTTAPIEVGANPISQGTASTSTAENAPRRFPSDFYRYATREPNPVKWTVLSEDTAVSQSMRRSRSNHSIIFGVHSLKMVLLSSTIFRWKLIRTSKYCMFLAAVSLMEIVTRAQRNFPVCTNIILLRESGSRCCTSPIHHLLRMLAKWACRDDSGSSKSVRTIPARFGTHYRVAGSMQVTDERGKVTRWSTIHATSAYSSWLAKEVTVSWPTCTFMTQHHRKSRRLPRISAHQAVRTRVSANEPQ